MKELKEIILYQYQKYPLMQLQDFLTLFYQNSFGPIHTAFGLNDLEIKNQIQRELDELDEPLSGNQLEYIGNDYYRVSLQMIDDSVLTIDEMAEAFYQSIINSPSMEDKDIDLFSKQVEMLRYFVLEDLIHFDMTQVDAFVDEYFYKGISPLHHSSIYINNYKPHYRIIHKDFIKDIIGVKK